MSELPLTHEHVAGAADGPVLLLLHGTGGSPQDLRGIAAELSPGSPLIAPAGPVSEGGAARWFRRLAEGVFDHEDVVRRTDQVAGFVRAAVEHYGYQDRRLVAVGFSNGANIAAALTLLRPDVLREAVLFSSMLPVPDPPEHDLSGSRIFLGNGRVDPMAPLDSANRLVEVLRARSAEVAEDWHDGGHQITMPGVRAAADWLARR